MMETRIYDLAQVDWERLRPDLTTGVEAFPLLGKASPGTRVSLTRISAGGEFRTHSDPYHHIFLFLAGTGEGWVTGKKYLIQPGRVVEVPAGEPHGFQNTGIDTMQVLTMNIPADRSA